MRRASWSHSLTAAESAELTPFLDRISLLKDELSGGELISVFVGRRVPPLQHRASPMWQYLGPADPTRCSPEEFESSELLTRLQWVTKYSSDSEMRLARPYSTEHPPPQVCDRVVMPVFVRVFIF